MTAVDVPVVTMGPVVSSQAEGGCRVQADVAGTPVWYESHDAALDDGPEAMAGTALLPALAGGMELALTEPVSREWLENVTRLMKVWQEWWGYPVRPLRAPVLAGDRPPAAGTALCFTGGVDSFHTLLCGELRPDILAFVQGYLVGLADEQKMRAWLPSFRAAASESGARSVLMRSNLWSHPLYRSADKRHAVGTALVAPGHLLVGEVGTLLVSSGLPSRYATPTDSLYGTHWDTDPLWSSDRLRVVHYGAETSRVEKVRAIASQDVVREHLQVCNRPGPGNCSRCGKCVGTMAIIAACERPERFATFDWTIPVADLLDRRESTIYVGTFAEVLETGGLDRRTSRSVRQLLRRTRKRAG